MLFFVSKKREKDIESRGYQQAIKDIFIFKDKIYFEPLTLQGDNQTIVNCAFFGKTGIKLETAREATGDL